MNTLVGQMKYSSLPKSSFLGIVQFAPKLIHYSQAHFVAGSFGDLLYSGE